MIKHVSAFAKSALQTLPLAIAAVVTVLALGISAGWASAAPAFVPKVDMLDLQGSLLPDVEFDHTGYQAAWQSEQLGLWVAQVDRQTGLINLSSALLLATGLAPSVGLTDGSATGNGPEWADSSIGGQIVYSIQDGPLGKENWKVGVATKTNGVWQTGFANEPNRLFGGAPEPSKQTADPNPLVAYYYQPLGQTYLQVYWHSLVNSLEGGVLPFINAGPGRWGKDNHLFVATTKVNGINQVALFDASKPTTYTQISFDTAFTKSKPWIFQSPEFGANVIMALESTVASPNSPVQIGLYRKINGNWTRFETVQPPPSSGFNLLNSAEPFVYNGASYISLAQIGTNPTKNGSKIWIAGIATNKFYRQVAGPADGVISTDPEYLETENGLYLYLGQRGGQQIYRAWTGIGPRSQTLPLGMSYIPKSTANVGDSLGDGTSDELPVHSVTSNAFYIDRYQVTSQLWQTVTTWGAQHGYTFSARVSKGPDYPITATWFEAARWCNARSEMEGRTPAYYTNGGMTAVYRTGEVNLKVTWVNWASGYRLPTESEWETAARGGVSGHRFAWVDSDTISHASANYFSTTLQPYDVSPTSGYNPAFVTLDLPYTAPVTSFTSNPYGLHSMSGNVWQWCWDWYNANSYAEAASKNPRGVATGSRKVIRGGSWASNAYDCRVARRGDAATQTQSDLIGFRTVLPE